MRQREFLKGRSGRETNGQGRRIIENNRERPSAAKLNCSSHILPIHINFISVYMYVYLGIALEYIKYDKRCGSSHDVKLNQVNDYVYQIILYLCINIIFDCEILLNILFMYEGKYFCDLIYSQYI